MAWYQAWSVWRVKATQPPSSPSAEARSNDHVSLQPGPTGSCGCSSAGRGATRPSSRATMHAVQFLSDEWLAAMDEAARDRVAPEPDPLADVAVTIEQVVLDGPRWRLVV